MIVADDPDPRRLGEAVLAALGAGRAVAVLDGRWPPARLAAARAAVIASADRIGPGGLVVFTSGSAGAPRAVHRSLGSWRASAEPLTELLGLRPDDVTWLPGHPASTLSLYAAWHAHDAGTRVRYATEPHGDATIVHAVPSLVPAVLQARAAGELPRLRVVVTAGDRVPVLLARRCAEVGVRLLAYYGAAELSFVGIAEEVSDGSGVCAYRAFPGVEVDVRDGLLWSRSPYQAYGYLGEVPWGTASDDVVHSARPVDGGRYAGPLRRTSDGWACVGDAARPVDTGRVEILGRADGAVTVAGHTILPEEVEDVLRTCPELSDALVVGLPDRVHGARLVALWVDASVAAELDEGGRPAQGVSPREVSGRPPAGVGPFVGRLPVPARPRRWIRVPALPRTPADKPDRAAARRLAETATTMATMTGARVAGARTATTGTKVTVT